MGDKTQVVLPGQASQGCVEHEQPVVRYEPAGHGEQVGDAVGELVGGRVGEKVGDAVGDKVVGLDVGVSVLGLAVGDDVGA